MAPALSTRLILSAVMSASLCLIFSSSLGSLTSTCTPICSLAFCRFTSRQATLAPVTPLTIPWAALPWFSARPSRSADSWALLPWALSTEMLFRGYTVLPVEGFTVPTALMASTTREAKCSGSLPMIWMGKEEKKEARAWRDGLRGR